MKKYSQKSEYLTFLNKNENNITTLVEGYSIYNLRSIFFFTDILLKIFSYLPDKATVQEQVIFFSFLLTLEFKKGSFHLNEFQKRKELIDLTNNLIYYELIEKNTEAEYEPNSFGAEICIQLPRKHPQIL